MPSIQTVDARALFTKMLIDVYRSKPVPTNFLRTFFPTVTSNTLEVSIEVQRGLEKVAVDVVRGTEGNRNSFSKATEKIFIPPLYKEYFDATELQLYNSLFARTEINDATFGAFLDDVANNLTTLREKIERAYELQCAQVLQTGIVTLKSATSIDFKRKAGSLVDLGSGNYFANNVDPFVVLEAGCTFMREKGKASDGIFNAICGSTALADLLKNTVFTTRQNLFNMALDSVQGPVRDGMTGANYHGTITCGAYKVQLFSYPQSYDDASNVAQPYIDPKKITLVPITPRFKLAFGAVPQLLTSGGKVPIQGDYVFKDFTDERLCTHDFEVSSAGIAIPVAIDQLYTVKVVA